MKGLSSEGRGLMRAGLVDRAMKQSINKQGQFDLLTFNGKLRQLGDTLKATLTREQHLELQGFSKILNTYAVGIQAGQSNSLYMQGILGLGGGIIAIANPAVGLTLAAVVKGMSATLSSPVSSKLLLKAASSPMNSPALQAITNAFVVASTK